MSEPPHQVFHLCCWACVECTMRVRNCVGAQLRQRSLGRCEAAASLLGRPQVLDDVEVGPPDMCAGLRPCTLQYFCRPGTLMYIYAQKLACTRTHTHGRTQLGNCARRRRLVCVHMYATVVNLCVCTRRDFPTFALVCIQVRT